MLKPPWRKGYKKIGNGDSKLNPNVLKMEREIKRKEIKTRIGKEGGIEIK
jgi:hypothetical protein